MASFIFLLLAVVCLGAYFWNVNRQRSALAGNRYRKKYVAVTSERSIESRLSAKDPLDDDDYYEDQENEKEFDREPIPEEAGHAQVVALYLMADEHAPFSGYELLQGLLSAGLRYGSHRIFHRHAQSDGRGSVLFHCASAMAPGTFDLTKMGSTTCKGLSFFFSTSDVEDPMAAFQCMLETIDQLVEDLGGRVLDEHRQLLTTDKMLALREQLQTVSI